jgi:hypothetical protein
VRALKQIQSDIDERKTALQNSIRRMRHERQVCGAGGAERSCPIPDFIISLMLFILTTNPVVRHAG